MENTIKDIEDRLNDTSTETVSRRKKPNTKLVITSSTVEPKIITREGVTDE